MITKFIIAATFLAAFVTTTASYPYPQLTLTACEDAPPLARHGSVGAKGSTGPTFPSFCRQAALI